MDQSEVSVSWEELGIANDFMFGRIMQNPELCKELLQRILPELQIDHVEYPELQKDIHPDVDAKNVRLDVYVPEKKSEDAFVRELEAAVREARKNRKWRHEYMTLLMRDQENIEKGMEKGMEKGIRGMVSSLRDFSIPDHAILEKIQEKYNLSLEEAEYYIKE